MSPYDFELAEDGPMAFDLGLATIFAADLSGSKIEAVRKVDGMIRITFDKDVSQSLIVSILEMILEAKA